MSWIKQPVFTTILQIDELIVQLLSSYSMLFHLCFPKQNKKHFSSHLLQLEHGDPVRADAGAREARELVR